jgi:hypothetical protein
MKVKAKMYPLSLMPHQKEVADRRVVDLYPWVSSFSNYVQQLLELDRKYDLLSRRWTPADDARAGAVGSNSEIADALARYKKRVAGKARKTSGTQHKSKT